MLIHSTHELVVVDRDSRRRESLLLRAPPLSTENGTCAERSVSVRHKLGQNGVFPREGENTVTRHLPNIITSFEVLAFHVL